MMDIRALQTTLGVKPDGQFGRASFYAFFAKCGAGRDMAQELAICAAVHFAPAGLMDSAQRLAHFTAQLLHESGTFKYMEEVASGADYEGRQDLGNTQPGDGKRYKGRGPIQITGRANHRKYGHLLGIDLERHPELAAIPSIGLRIAILYWTENKLNTLADRGDTAGITKRINGGQNGLFDRQKKLIQLLGWVL